MDRRAGCILKNELKVTPIESILIEADIFKRIELKKVNIQMLKPKWIL